MRRFSIGLSLGLTTGLLIGLLVTSSFVLASQPIKILINGVELNTDVPAQIIDGRTMVPLGSIAKALGAAVTWDSNNNTVVITTNNQATNASKHTNNTVIAVVNDLYNALNAKQFDKVADSFNVTFLAEFMPEYLNKKPSELLAIRTELVEKSSELFAKKQTESTFAITVLEANTKVGDYAAVIPYYLENDGKKQLLAAILVNENGKFKILSISSYTEANMQDFSDAKFMVLEENIKAQFEQAEKK